MYKNIGYIKRFTLLIFSRVYFLHPLSALATSPNSVFSIFNNAFSCFYFLLIATAFFGMANPAFAATFVDDTQGAFDAGTSSNTAWNTNHVELSSGQTSGTFTSQVFDGGSADTVSWSQLAWSETLTSVDKLLLVDTNADIFKSIDDGANWSLAKDDYTGDDANNATDMVQGSNNTIFILFNQTIWKSTDAGVSWTKVNDDYNGGEGQNGQRIAVDGSNNLYVVEADEDVWQSTDSGVNWTKVGNTGSADTKGFVGVSSTLFLVDTTADVWSSTDSGANWSLIKEDYTGADVNNADYMVADSNGNLIILFNQDVWRSTDSGANWTKVHDDYNDGEGQDGILLARNSSNELFIVEGDDDIWQSTDNGTSWTKLGNFGGGTVSGLVYVDISTDITFSTRSGSANPPTDSFSGTFTSSSGEDPNVSAARYFQYHATFSSEDSEVTPELSSVTATYSVSDTTAPSAVSDLALSNPSNSAMTVSWTAPGDDSNSGTATTYDLRYSTSEITDGNWSSATKASGEPTPSAASSSESMTVIGLTSNTTYFFALKTSDEVPNTSDISNSTSSTTEEDEPESSGGGSSGGGGGGGSSGNSSRGSVIPSLPATGSTASTSVGVSENSDRIRAIARTILSPPDFWTQPVLPLGAVSENIRALQIFLNTLSFTLAKTGPGSPGRETNVFGPLTKAALAQFQLANGIVPATGYFGPKTRALIAVLSLSLAVPVQTGQANTSVAPANPIFTRDLKLGMSGLDVNALQQLLIAKNTGPEARALGSFGTTTYFGPLTKAAVIEYQKAYNIIPAVGYFGAITRGHIK